MTLLEPAVDADCDCVCVVLNDALEDIERVMLAATVADVLLLALRDGETLELDEADKLADGVRERVVLALDV